MGGGVGDGNFHAFEFSLYTVEKKGGLTRLRTYLCLHMAGFD